MSNNHFLDLCFVVSPLLEGTSILRLEIMVDQEIVFNAPVTGPEVIHYNLLEVDAVHCVKLEMSGKADADSRLAIDLWACDLNVSQFLIDAGHSVGQYTHNFNGNGATITESFDHVMGCNGVVNIFIATPLASWLMNKIIHV